MDTKKVIVFIVISFSIASSYLNVYGQSINLDDNTIEWKSKVCMDSISYMDTSQIISDCGRKLVIPISYCTTKTIILNGKQFFCSFWPIGSGIPKWKVLVYRKNEKWSLIAEGEVIRNGVIMADNLGNNGKRVIYTLEADADEDGNRIIFKDDGRIIGELNFNIGSKDVILNKRLFKFLRHFSEKFPYQGVSSNCVNWASLGLWLNGIPNIGIHPFLLHASLELYNTHIYDILATRPFAYF